MALSRIVFIIFCVCILCLCNLARPVSPVHSHYANNREYRWKVKAKPSSCPCREQCVMPGQSESSVGGAFSELGSRPHTSLHCTTFDFDGFQRHVPTYLCTCAIIFFLFCLLLLGRRSLEYWVESASFWAMLFVSTICSQEIRWKWNYCKLLTLTCTNLIFHVSWAFSGSFIYHHKHHVMKWRCIVVHSTLKISVEGNVNRYGLAFSIKCCFYRCSQFLYNLC